MNTSKYTSTQRYSIKRELRSPEVQDILDAGRKERSALEAKLTERNTEISNLRSAIQKLIDSGSWDNSLKSLGFTKRI